MNGLLSFFVVLTFSTTADFTDGGNALSSLDSVVSLVIVGANGDLARKKLWPALQELYLTKTIDFSTLYVYAATREPTDTATENFRTFFSELRCPEKSLTQEQCESTNNEIFRNLQMVQLKSESDYIELSDRIKLRTTSDQKIESTRIFYLAVPPFAYAGIAKNIHKYCSITDTRVAIEKPFGRDLPSATVLADEIRNFLSDDQIYLVDHYLHKPGVQQIANFRMINEKRLASVWNGGGISRVEIVVREASTAVGRTGYYDHYGVIRDMLQSHLTEILALLTAHLKEDTLSDSESLNRAKFDVLSRIYPPYKESASIGQYVGYQEHVCEASSDCAEASATPTFASVVLYVKDDRWASVPFILVSGKAMQKREAYVRVIFKKVAKFKPHLLNAGAELCSEEMVFSIHDEVGESCHVCVPSNEGYQSPFAGSEIKQDITDSNGCHVDKFSPNEDATVLHPYASVLKGVIEGRREEFVPLRNVLESWRVWSPLLSELEREHSQNIWLYQEDIWNILSLNVSGTRMSSPIEQVDTVQSNSHMYMPTQFATNTTTDFSTHTGKPALDTSLERLLGHRMIVLPWSSLVLSAAKDINDAALDSVSKRGVFHLALPGGTSALGIYQALLLNYKDTFPWANVHIWQSDERCVPPTSLDSNLYRISVDLLKFVPIPITNIHPLIDLTFTPCVSEDTVDSKMILDNYWTKLSHSGGLSRFDYVLLGMGSDGHIASIFPSEASQYKEISSNLTVTHILEDYPIYIKHRVSVTLETIVAAHHIGLIIVGENKCQVIKHKDSNTPFYKLINLAPENILKVFLDINVCTI